MDVATWGIIMKYYNAFWTQDYDATCKTLREIIDQGVSYTHLTQQEEIQGLDNYITHVEEMFSTIDFKSTKMYNFVVMSDTGLSDNTVVYNINQTHMKEKEFKDLDMRSYTEAVPVKMNGSVTDQFFIYDGKIQGITRTDHFREDKY